MTTPIEIARGRRAVIRTDIPDWITMAPISSQAYRIYGILAAHVNQDRGDQQAWPTMGTLAELVSGVSRGDKLARYIRELEDLGAITVLRRQGMPAHNIYIVHETPPDGYAAPMTVAGWYHARKANAQVRPVAPSTGQLDSDPKGQTPVAPSTGQPVAPSTGQPVAPSTGHKQPRTNKEEDLTREDQPPPTPTVIDTGSAPSKVPAQKQGGESSPRTKPTPSRSDDAPDVAAAAAELAALASPAKPGWTVAATVAALAELLAEGRRTWPTILLVARRAAADPGTLFPGRMVRGQIPEEWWAQATPPTARAKTCGCLRGVVLVEEIVDGIPTGRDRPQSCPDCSAGVVAA